MMLPKAESGLLEWQVHEQVPATPSHWWASMAHQSRTVEVTFIGHWSVSRIRCSFQTSTVS